MNKRILTSVLLTFSLVFTQATMAASVTQKWAVTDAQKNGDDHGLWTNGLGADENEKRHSFNAGSMLTEYDNGTAHLMSTATNRNGRTATIDITFGGYLAAYGVNKTVGGPVLPSWYYYSTIQEGSTIKIDGITYFIDMVDSANPNRIGESPILQIGTGANDKNGAFGASTWLDIFLLQELEVIAARSLQPQFVKQFGNSHWDLNMNLTAVPIPAAVWLFGSALMGFVGLRRKAKQA